MKKLLLLLGISTVSIITNAQTYSGQMGFETVESQVISIDTTVLKGGSASCRHYYQSANAEAQRKSEMYLVMHIQHCLPEHEDRLICAKCLRHIRIVYHNECVTVRTYSELLKEIESERH